MNNSATPARVVSARQWLSTLAKYREPSPARSIGEIAITAVPFVALWTCAWAALSVSYWLTLLIALPAATFLVRLFLIQHDCGHGSFFRHRGVNDWTGRALSVFTLTPYDDWKRNHALHHTTSGNLDHRGFGDIRTMTVKEYSESSLVQRLLYRLYRHPVVMLGLGPGYIFIIRNRIPAGIVRDGWRPWLHVMATNAAIAVVVGAAIWALGWKSFLLVHLPIVLLAATIGVWLFYVQHQFEETYWQPHGEWSQQDAALYGSSHYDLPGILRWLTANIGVHHVHHLASGIPYYRLQQVLREHPGISGGVRRLSMAESLSCLRLRLWDEGQRRLVSFKEARRNAA